MDNILNRTIYENCKKVEDALKGNSSAISPSPKTFLMSYVAQNQNVKNFVEIGVHRGRGLLSTAYSVYKNGGKSYGIDSYLSTELAKENNTETIYKDMLAYKDECGYGENVTIIREVPTQALNFFIDNEIHPDMMLISNVTGFTCADFDLYFKQTKKYTVFAFDNLDNDEVKAIYEHAKKRCLCIFEFENFAFLLKNDHSVECHLKAEKLFKKLSATYERMAIINAEPETPLITIGILTYNHSKYIKECLASVFEQYGNFKLNVIICDDHSTDGTIEAVYEFICSIPANNNIICSIHTNETNIGIIPNLNKLINLIKASGCDYFSFCEGDDYYATSNRLAKHLDFCRNNPQLVSSYNKVMLYWQEDEKYEIHDLGFKGNVLPTEELAVQNYIGNFSATFFSGSVLRYIDDSLFADKFSVDWMFNLYCSQFGDIGVLNMPYTVYRKHENGVWSGQKYTEQCKFLIEEINKYDRYLNFTYEPQFQDYCSRLMLDLENFGVHYPENTSVAIIDDFFPHLHSGFRYQEFNSILQSIPNSVVYSDCSIIHNLDTEKSQETILNEIMINYKRLNPDMCDRVLRLNDNTTINAKLLYCTFLSNAYSRVVDLAEKHQIPFVFTLYPGSSFAIGDEESDKKLRRVFSSPWFYKVIVTQDLTHKYLVENGFCREEQIEDIFGIVIPLEKFELNLENKKHFGINKDTLDICFVANKYTPYGQDKGYDVFIETAKELSRKYDFINFHVVGPWNENILDTSEIKNITFYGSQDQKWFDSFYEDKDIILSPNIDGQIFKGSFDGFPTGCLTDAALRKVAMFLTDPLSLNNNRFINNEEMVLINHDKDDIVSKIEYFLDKPQELKNICENGCQKVKALYNYDAQIAPRLKLLSNALEIDSQPNETEIIEEFENVVCGEPIAKERFIKVVYRECTPRLFQRLYRFFRHIFAVLYRELVPNIFQRIYRKIKRIIKKILGR